MTEAETTTDTLSDESTALPPVKLFGDPRSAIVKRGPDRRIARPIDGSEAHEPHRVEIDRAMLAPERSSGPGRALRLGRGDGFATALNGLGLLVFAVSIIAGGLILNNAQDVGAFSDPWNSNRVAIGLTVLAVGIVLAALLVGVARILTYQLATLRLKLRELDAPHTAASNHG